MGFSNSKHSTVIEPKLTTVDQPGNTMGKTAIKYLIEEIENDDANDITMNKTVEVKTELIVRASTFKIF
nr:substrate-binding domain-containing protein [Aquimarina sp. AU474]